MIENQNDLKVFSVITEKRKRTQNFKMLAEERPYNQIKNSSQVNSSHSKMDQEIITKIKSHLSGTLFDLPNYLLRENTEVFQKEGTFEHLNYIIQCLYLQNYSTIE